MTFPALDVVGFDPKVGAPNADAILAHANMIYMAIPFCTDLFIAHIPSLA